MIRAPAGDIPDRTINPARANDRGAHRHFLTFSLLLLASGCAPHAKLDIVDMNFRRIDPRQPLVRPIDCPNCYWWIEDDSIYVALHEQSGPLTSEARRQGFDISFLLVGLPAESARDYSLDIQSMRALRQDGAIHERYASTAGILAVWKHPGDMLEGRFRLLAKKQSFHILTGWNDAGQSLITGRFLCALNSVAGKKILATTESHGLQRGQQPAIPQPRRVLGPPVKTRR